MANLEMPTGEMNEILLVPPSTVNGSTASFSPMPSIAQLSSGSVDSDATLALSGWSQWQDLKGCCISSPAATAKENRIDVFAIGTDSKLYHKYLDGSQLGDWTPIAGSTCIGKPAAVWRKERLEVFAIGIDKTLYHNCWDGSKWLGWESRGGTCIHGVTAASWGDRIDLFTVGTNSVIYQKVLIGEEDQGWRPLILKGQDDWEKSSTSVCAPAAVSSKEGRIDIFTLGIDNKVYRAWGDGSTWEGWQELGGPAIQGVAVASRSENCLDLFTVSTDIDGTDNHLYHRIMKDDTWSDWKNLGGVCVSAPTAVASGGNLYTFVVGTKSKLWQKLLLNENSNIGVQTIGSFEIVEDIDGDRHELWRQTQTCGCGPSCVAMIARKFNKSPDERWVSQIISRMEGKTLIGDPIHDFNAIGTWNVQGVINELGITSAYTDKSGKFTTIFKERCNKRRPAMAWLVWTKQLLWSGTRWEWIDIPQSLHWVVILGQSRTNPTKYIVLDPWYGLSTQDFPPIAPPSPIAPPPPIAPLPVTPSPPASASPLSEYMEYIVPIFPYSDTTIRTWQKGEFRNVDGSGIARGVITT